MEIPLVTGLQGSMCQDEMKIRVAAPQGVIHLHKGTIHQVILHQEIHHHPEAITAVEVHPHAAAAAVAAVPEEGQDKMKRYFLIFVLFITLSVLPGCYTVLWTPEDEFPSSEKYRQENYDENNYYADSYYGEYGYYYQYPWWLSIAPPAYSAPGRDNGDDNNDRSDSPAMERLRNRDGSRNSGSGRETIINNAPVTRSSGSSGSSGSSTSTESSGKTRESSNSGSNSSGNSGRSSGSNDSNSSRNDNGGRNNGGRK